MKGMHTPPGARRFQLNTLIMQSCAKATEPNYSVSDSDDREIVLHRSTMQAFV